MADNVLTKIYELREYDTDTARFVAGQAEFLYKDLQDRAITQSEYKELVEDLRQTKRVSELAEDLETKILIEEILRDLSSVIGVL